MTLQKVLENIKVALIAMRWPKLCAQIDVSSIKNAFQTGDHHLTSTSGTLKTKIAAQSASKKLLASDSTDSSKNSQ